jgi:hypothetical protein
MANDMRNQESFRDGGRLSRRQALGRMSVVATAGAAVWLATAILTAKPAAGATLSGGTSARVAARVA